MSTPFLSEIRLMSFAFPPKGWALCNGQLLPINQNQALFALLGTSFNGLAFVLNKYLQRPGGDSQLTTMFYVNAVAVVCNLPVLTATALPEPAVWPWLSGVLIFGPVGMYIGIVAVRHASASSLGPYTFLRLVIAVFFGIILFREIPDLLSWLGVAAILSGQVKATGTTVVVLSGGNIDPLMMERVISHGLAASERILKLRIPLHDRPGQLARVSTIVAESMTRQSR